MELVANVWPIYDHSGLVLRYLMRAYAMDASDDVISQTLHGFAETGYILARAFPIPKHCQVISEHGTLNGCVHVGDFREHLEIILSNAFAELEKGYAKVQGVVVPGGGRRSRT